MNIVEISGTQYRIKKLGARQGRAVLMRIGTVVAGVLGSIEGSRKSPELVIADAVKTFCTTAKDADVSFVEDAFASHCEIGMRTEQGNIIWMPLVERLDSHFSGKYLQMGRWFAACAKENFAGFLDEARNAPKEESLFFQLLNLLGEVWQSQKKSTGSSGESSAAPASTSP